MSFDLLGSTRRSATAFDLIARRTYNDALEAILQQGEGSTADTSMRILAAEMLVLQGKIDQAAEMLVAVADRFAEQRLVGQAIAVLKKVQRLDPSRTELEARIVELFKAAPPHEQAMLSAEAKRVETAPGMAQQQRSAEMPTRSFVPPPVDENELLAAVAAGIDVDGLLARALGEDRAPRPSVSSVLFDEFSDQELLEVIRGLELLTFEAGDIIITEGEAGETLYVLTSGTAKAFVRNRSEGSTQVRQLHEGDFFGEIAMLSGSRRTATITAATRCEILRLDRATVDEIATTHPRVLEVLQQFYDERANNAAEAEIRGLDPATSDACRASGLTDEVGLDAPAAAEDRPTTVTGIALMRLRRRAIEQSRRQNWPDAVLAWQQVTALNPEDVDAAMALGLLYGKLGRWLDAAHVFERLVARNSSDPALLFNLGLSYRQLELLPQAAAAYRKALALKPDYDKARQALTAVTALLTKWRAG